MELGAGSGFSTWKLVATGILVLLNGFFVAAEFALVKVRPTRINAIANRGSRAARIISLMMSDLSLYLSACQLGITLASLALGWLAEPAVATLIVGAAEGLGMAVDDSPLLHIVALAIALTIITILHMTVGEQAPKVFAIQKPETMAMIAAFPLRYFTMVLRPIIWFINKVSNGLLRLTGIRDVDAHEESHDLEELRAVLRSASRAGHISMRQRALGENILGLIRLEVRHIMLPRIDVVYLSTTFSEKQNLKIVRESGHSRFPLCNGDLDDIVGIVHGKDILATMLDDASSPIDPVKLSRPQLTVPDTQPISLLILEFQQVQQQLAVVVDEHGTTVGLAFLEDALEEIVGPMHDEFDAKELQPEEGQETVLELLGSMPLPEAELLLAIDLESDEDTVGGYVTEQLKRFPSEGEQIDIPSYRATVLEMSQRRIDRVRFERIEPESHE